MNSENLQMARIRRRLDTLYKVSSYILASEIVLSFVMIICACVKLVIPVLVLTGVLLALTVAYLIIAARIDALLDLHEKERAVPPHKQNKS